MKNAIDTLESVLQELDMGETEAVRIICNIIKYNAEKYKSKELKELAKIFSMWNRKPVSDILDCLNKIQEDI